MESTFKPTGKKADYENYWEAPTYLWVQKEVSEREMEAVMVSNLSFFFSFWIALRKSLRKGLTNPNPIDDSLAGRQILGLDLEGLRV